MNEIYLALGDSITAGYGVGVNQSFASQMYRCLLASFPGLCYRNLGINGLTSGGLVSVVGQTKIGFLIRESKIITITIGSNDLLAIGKGLISGRAINFDFSLGVLNQNLMILGERLRSLNPTAVIKIATIYDPLPLINEKMDLMAHGLVKTANRNIQRMARENRFTVVPVDKVFSGREQELLGPDHLHPNVLGHRVIADLFL